MSPHQGLDRNTDVKANATGREAKIGVLAAPAATMLTACGGGGGGGGGGGAPTPGAGAPASTTNDSPAAPTNSTGVPVAGSPLVAGAATTTYTTPATDRDAARFLSQAAPGASKAQITALRGTPYAAWIDDQFNLPRSQGHCDWMTAQGYTSPDNLGQYRGLDNTLWRKFISSPDPLRQRITLALSEIFVVSLDGLNVWWPQFSVGNFVDILEANAFGNYRTLMQSVTLTTAMGAYLTYAGNQPGDPATGSLPDENYAREIMQLFTIGLYNLHNDGSHVLVNGQPVETYTQADVSGLARVFTGWSGDPSNGEQAPITFQIPMIVSPSNYESGAKTFLGTTIPAGAQTAADALIALNTALDTLFNHPNAPPFVGRQLIQRLVTSNPSPAYIERVAHAFIDNGQGVRGDMKAVIRQILLDDEARNPAIATTIAFGKLREPVMRFLNWARAFNVTSPRGHWALGNLSDAASGLAQSPMHSPSVFNFFRPGYAPVAGALGAYNSTNPPPALPLVGPEFQITNESSVAGYVNFMQNAVNGQGVGDLQADYASLIPLAADAGALLDELNLVLAASQISAPTLATLKSALDTVPTDTDAGKLNRIYAALVLVLASPEYIVQK